MEERSAAAITNALKNLSEKTVLFWCSFPPKAKSGQAADLKFGALLSIGFSSAHAKFEPDPTVSFRVVSAGVREIVPPGSHQYPTGRLALTRSQIHGPSGPLR